MTTVKRVTGDYVLTTLGASGNVILNTNVVQAGNSLITGNLTATGNVSLAGANVTADNITGASLSVTGNVTAGIDVRTVNVIATGNVQAAVFIGDGSGLTGVPAGNALGNIISFGTSRVAIPQLSGNVFVNVSGVSNVAVFSSQGVDFLGNVDVLGNAAISENFSANAYFFANGQPLTGSVKYDAFPVAPPGTPNPGDFWFNTTNGILYQYNDDGDSDQWVDISGIGTPPASTSAVANSAIQRDLNASATANVYYGNGVIMTGNVQASYFVGNGSALTGISTESNRIFNGTSNVLIGAAGGNIVATVNGTNIVAITSAGIENSQSNAVGNIGSVSRYFNRVFATSTSALYADLAEVYTSDDDYAVGTVICIGGGGEVTQSTRDHDHAVIGCVSHKPAVIMNSGSAGVTVALTGKVRCRVQGPVRRGDLLVTGSLPGHAQALIRDKWQPGTVFAKAMQDFAGDSGMIDVLVGRY
jgi:hypothetical protein